MGKPRAPYLAVVILTLAAFAVRAVSLDAHSLWRDEVDAMRFASAPLREIVTNFSRPGWNGPLYFFLLRGWIALTGTSEYGMRFFSLLFGVLGVPLAYILGKRLFTPQAGLIAALLVTASPYLTWYGQEVKMYTLLPALVLLAIYGLRRAVDGEGWGWWVVQSVATTLAFYAHILAALLIPVQVIVYFVWWPQARKQWRGAVISIASLTLPYLPLAVWQIPLLFSDSVAGQPIDQAVQAVLENWRAGNLLLLRARETGFSRFSLGEMVQILLDYWSVGELGTYGTGWPWATVLMVVLLAWSLLSPKISRFPHNRPAVRNTIALLVWMVFPPLVVWYVSRWQPLFTDRYFVWSALPFYLLIATGLSCLFGLKVWGQWAAMILIGAILGLNGLNQWQQATIDGKADYRAAAAYVAANYSMSGERSTGVVAPVSDPCSECTVRVYAPVIANRYPKYPLIVFQIPYARHSFDYYYPDEAYRWADGLYTNHRYADGAYMMSEDNAALAMETLTAEQDVVWLFATETWMWDERGLVKAWLDSHMQLADEAHFKWVDVYRYER
jgi:4-amino-4-deoxy-L-arabinose transferase-like glycosyltransferase